jgi:hypothetical protein
MNRTMLGLFRPLEEYVGISVWAVGALCFIVFLRCMLQFSYLLVRDPPFFSMGTEIKNCGQINPDTTVRRIGYKLKMVYASNPSWRGIRYCHFCVKWMAYILFIILLLFMQLLCLPCEVWSLMARLQRVPVQRDKWSS